MIKIINPTTGESLYKSAKGFVDQKGNIVFPYRNGAYRIVQNNNYTSNFGFEWNAFQKTQIDKFSGSDISQKRFFSETRWERDLEGENILEVGCGAGRFSQIVLDYTRANLYSVDYSNAVDANFRNNGPNEKFKLFQANIYELPFQKNSFDKVFCLGVLQHTPDFKKSVQCLIEMVTPGGELVVDFYPIKGWYSKINAKYILRPFLKKISNEKLMNLISKNINWLTKIYLFNNRIGLGVLNRFVPICDIRSSFLIPNQEELREWRILDTFDMFSPSYDSPQKLETVANWFKEFGMIDVDAQFIKYDAAFEAATVKGRKNIN